MSKKKLPKKNAYEIKKDVAYFTKNRLPAFILAGLIIFWTIASVLGIIAFASDKKSSPKGLVTANADSFEGALRYEYAVDIVPLFGMINYNSLNHDVFDKMFTFHIDSTGAYLSYGDTSIFDNQERTIYPYGLDGQALQVTCGFSIITTEYVDDILYEDISTNVYYDSFNGNNVSEFSIVIDFVQAGNTYSVHLLLTLDLNYDFVYVPFDNVEFSLPDSNMYLGSWSSHVPYSDSWYYYSEYIKGIGDYNLGYNEGYLQGLKNPNQNSYNEGYTKGSADGYHNGYNAGYQEGLGDENDYSFTGLISSVIDVPIQAFTSLFNFDLLGVNLANFFFALLTVAILLAFVRMLL